MGDPNETSVRKTDVSMNKKVLMSDEIRNAEEVLKQKKNR